MLTGFALGAGELWIAHRIPSCPVRGPNKASRGFEVAVGAGRPECPETPSNLALAFRAPDILDGMGV